MERSNRTTWFLAAVLLLLLGLLISRYRSAEAPRTVAPPSQAAGGAVAMMEGMRAAEYRDGVKRWDLTAERADYRKGIDRTVLTGVSLSVVGKRPVGPVTLVAKQAEFLNASKNLLLPVGVSASGDRHLHFTAGQAVFSNASSLVTARGQVRYKDDMMQVEGEEMVFNTETRALQLHRNVRAMIQPQAVRR